MNIEFINFSSFKNIEQPKPASKFLPDWYKNLDSYVYKEKKPPVDILLNSTSSTIKKCIPVFDSITSGYILTTAADFYVSQEGDGYISYSWPSLNLISFHSKTQAIGHPKHKDIKNAIPKIENYWGIKTPKGYSCLFISPFHLNIPFSIFTGIVDTDSYNLPVLFPFVLNDQTFEGLIPAGTPYAQVIPFKRNDWTMKVNSDCHNPHNHDNSYKLSSRFFDRYKSSFWSKKTFK